MKILRRIERSREFWFVISASLLFFILRFPSLFEPLWYGDEGIYQAIGSSLNNGQLLYKEVFDNKPPLLYLVYAAFSSDQFGVRLASLISGLFSVITFFILSRKLFQDNRISYATTSVFAILFGLPVFEGNIANAENFMLLPIIAAALLITNFKFQISNFKLFLAGLLLGIAFLFKIVALFDFTAFLTFLFIINFTSLKNIKAVLKKLQPLVFGFFLPIILASLFFLSKGNFGNFFNAIFLSNISYVSYANKIGNIPFLLFAKIILLGTFISYVFKKNKNLNKTSLFILIWFAFSLFNTLFSQRPYTHYLLVLLPSLSLMIGLVFSEENKKIIVICLLIALAAIIKVFGIPNLNKNMNYYQNFISYIKGKNSTTAYQAFFDRKTPIDYEVARFIKPKLSINDTIFVWGNNAQLYKLTGVIPPTKYVVAYHISSYKDGILSTRNGIEKRKPKFIVVMPNQGMPPYPLINYSQKININNVIIYERIF